MARSQHYDLQGRAVMLPNAEEAIIDRRKLEAYCLSPMHPRGRHKAKVFKARLGIGPTGAAWLHEAILNALPTLDALTEGEDRYGRRFRVDVALERGSRHAMVRTLWIIRRGETTPRLITCYIL